MWQTNSTLAVGDNVGQNDSVITVNAKYEQNWTHDKAYAFTTPEWYTNTDNHIIKLSTPTHNTLWQVFAVYTIPAESYYLKHNFETPPYQVRYHQMV